MQELEKSRTALGRKRAPKPKAAPPRLVWLKRLPLAWIARAALVIAIGIGATVIGARIWRRRHAVIDRVDSAVGSAKSALERDRHQLVQRVDDAVGDAKSAINRDREQVEHQVGTAVQSAKSALHSLTNNQLSSPTARETPGVKLETAARARATSAPHKPVHFADAKRLVSAGKLDDAIQALYQLRRQSPQSADVALLLGHVYFRKQWRSDGLREYGEAVKLRPSLRSDGELERNDVVALDDPTFGMAAALVRERLGKASLTELRRAGRVARNPRVQKRAARLALEVAASPKLLSRPQ
jgi:hypothetical protein